MNSVASSCGLVPTTRHRRIDALGQAPLCIWLTGLPAAGKTSVAEQIESALLEAGLHTMHIDGDQMRRGLCRDLGMDRSGRQENVRRLTEVATVLLDAGVIVIISVIAPYAEDRAAARSRVGPERFIEVFVSTPLDVCIQRDSKGHYARALRGELPGFTGIDAPYEAPLAPDFSIDTATTSMPETLRALVAAVIARARP